MESARMIAWSAQLRRVHQRLTDALAIARESVESSESIDAREAVEQLADPLIYCWGLCSALDGHHEAEDGALFPRLRERHPELAPVLDNLTRDHRMIAHLLGELRRAMAAGDPPEDLRCHLDGIEAIMTTHVRYEEKRLVAVLDGLDLGSTPPPAIFGPLA